MLLIYVPRLTNRIGYTFNVVLRLMLRVDYEITTNSDYFAAHEGPKMCYSPRKVGDGMYVRSASLLFQTTIEELQPRCIVHEGIPALFPVNGRDSAFPFDPFAAAFFCLSRYEEYLPHITDVHGRFPATESVAFKEGFLQVAVVDRWALLLADALTEQFPEMNVPQRVFGFEDTFDIDAAYCYKHKGLARTLVGFARDLSSSGSSHEARCRWRTLTHRQQDPFDTFDYILEVHRKYPRMRLKFFPLVGDYNVYDKPISYLNGEFRQLLQHLGDSAKLGLHASYASHDNPRLIEIENQRLAAILHRKSTRNRYHFLRLSLPDSYNALLDNGIIHDYSMGYADEPGFRAGTGSPYPFFDLDSNSETGLTIHPFVVMDSTLKVYKQMEPSDAVKVYFSLLDEVKAVNGTFSALWHNQNLCERFGWEGWRKVYEDVLQRADELKKNSKRNK